MSFDFIVVDIDTANNNLNSACSLALVAVKDLEIVEKKHFLIASPAPLFPDVWKEIKHYFTDNMVIAHNSKFVMSVLKNCLLEYNLEVPNFTYLCSIPVSGRALKNKNIGRSLKDRASHFGIKLENENSTLERAVACGELIIACVRVKKRKSFASYGHNAIMLPYKSFRKLNPQTVLEKK
jgi:DNA polymerase III subunit epsilon